MFQNGRLTRRLGSKFCSKVIFALLDANASIYCARLQHVCLHAPVSFLIRLISRFSFQLKIGYVQLLWLWYVPVRGLLILSVLWISGDLCELS